MKKKSTLQSAFFNLRILLGLFIVLAGVFLALIGFGAFSGDNSPPAEAVEVETEGYTSDGEPDFEVPAWTSHPTPLTPDQIAKLKYWTEHTNLPGPVRGGALPGGLAPDPSTQSKVEELSTAKPLAAGDADIFRNNNVNAGGIIPLLSHTMEGTTAVGGKYAFYTGNWFAARSEDGGASWTYVSPTADMSDFCCDQHAIYDESRDRIYWLRLGVPGTNPTTGNYENRFKLGISSDGGATFCSGSKYPLNFNTTWTNQWFDFPKIALGADYLYITFNLFDPSENWLRSVIVRYPLDNLASCHVSGGYYHSDTSWFTFTPAQGTEHTAYYASNWPNTSPQNSRIKIWKWKEDTTSISSVTKNVTPWDFTTEGDAVCGSTTGNWTDRADQKKSPALGT